MLWIIERASLSSMSIGKDTEPKDQLTERKEIKMTGFIHTREELQHLQSLPLAEKVQLTRERIREWVEAWHGKVYVSFSGGKDSTVLLHMVREMYPGVPAVFSNTGLEFPEVRKFARMQDGVTEIRPEMTFVEVVKEEGYPLISKSVANAIKYARLHDPTGRRRRYMTGNVQVALQDGTMGRSMFDKSRWQKLAEEAPFRIPVFKSVLRICRKIRVIVRI